MEQSQGGLGIGLTLVRRLVEMHDGRVEARSEGLGRGSEFVVRLPVVVEASVPQRDHDEPAAPKSSLRILIVDDNRDGADSLAMMLRLMGNETATAYDGQEGVDMAGRFRPDVVLLDIGLPKLNGYEAARRIRAAAVGQAPGIDRRDGLGARRGPPPLARRRVRSPHGQAGGPDRPDEAAGWAVGRRKEVRATERRIVAENGQITEMLAGALVEQRTGPAK